MSITSRLARSFQDEFKRPATQALICAAIVFFLVAVLQQRYSWTDANRPWWITVLWYFSPLAFLMPAAQGTSLPAKVAWKRLGGCILLHFIFLGAYITVFEGRFHLLGAIATCCFLTLSCIEIATITWLFRTPILDSKTTGGEMECR